MRSLPLQCGSIRIATVSGERRRIHVSGLDKARLLWLFRNFYILDFSVLTKAQRQLIARMWNSGSAASASQLLPSLDLIGTVEGFSPKLFPPTLPAPPAPSGARRDLPSGWRTPALGTVLAILLVGAAIALAPMLRWMPPSRIASAVRANPPVDATLPLLVVASAKLAPPADGNSPPPAPDAAGILPLHLPGAMALNETSPAVSPPHSRTEFSPSSLPRPEVMINVIVDSEGRVQACHVLQGNPMKALGALKAAMQLSYQPCAVSAQCQHLLKFTDYGDASIVQRID